MSIRLMWIVLMLALSSAARYDRSIMRDGGDGRRPNPEPQIVWPNTEPEIPDHCRDQGLCEDVPNYPHEYFDHLLRHNTTVRNALSFYLGAYDSARGCKDGENPKKDMLCVSKTEVTQAKAAQDRNGQWYYLLPNQFICLEKCENNGGPCSNKAMRVYTGYKAICEQKYTRKRMVKVDGNGVMEYIDVARILSGCCCQVTEN